MSHTPSKPPRFRAAGRFLRDREGSIAVMSALLLPVVIGSVALAAEYGHGLVTLVEQQRTADLASYAGAVAYQASGSEAAMRAAALDVAALNGVPAEAVTVALVTSPRDGDAQAVRVDIHTTRQLLLAPILGIIPDLPVDAAAFAQFGSDAAGCIIALDAGKSGVTLSGGTSIVANDCSVASNATVSVPCGTTLTAVSVSHDSAGAPSQPCNGIRGPGGAAASISKTATADPLAGHAGVAAATARLATLAGLPAPAVPPAPSGTSIEFGWSTAPVQHAAASIGCAASFSSPVWTLSCPSGGTYNFGTITTGGGITVNFNTAGSAATTYNFSGSITNTGTAMAFGPGTYNIRQGFTGGGGSRTTFGAGTFRIGPVDANCAWDAGRHSICNTNGHRLEFGGPSTFELAGGFYNGGGSTLILGAGSDNSYRIGAAGTGDAIVLGGGATTLMADATGPDSVFEVGGHVNGAGGGGCFMVPAAAQHDISGNFNASGAVILGSGVYTIDGYFALGANGGGSANCNGQVVSVRGIDVTLVLSGRQAPGSGSCAGQVFCVAAGYSGVTLKAPTAGTTAGLAVVGPVGGTSTGGAVFNEGGNNARISGAFYFPRGAIAMTGGAGVGGGGGDCLQLIGASVTLAGGTTAASDCVGGAGGTGGGGGGSRVTLVQ